MGRAGGGRGALGEGEAGQPRGSQLQHQRARRPGVVRVLHSPAVAGAGPGRVACPALGSPRAAPQAASSQALAGSQRPHCLPGKRGGSRSARPPAGPSQAAAPLPATRAPRGLMSPPGLPRGRALHVLGDLGPGTLTGRSRSPRERPAQQARAHGDRDRQESPSPPPGPHSRALTSFVQPALLHDGRVVHGAVLRQPRRHCHSSRQGLPEPSRRPQPAGDREGWAHLLEGLPPSLQGTAPSLPPATPLC